MRNGNANDCFRSETNSYNSLPCWTVAMAVWRTVPGPTWTSWKYDSKISISHSAVQKVDIVTQAAPSILCECNDVAKTKPCLQSSRDYSGFWTHFTMGSSAERFFVALCVTVLLCALHFSLLTGHFLLPSISKKWNLIGVCVCPPGPQVNVWFSASEHNFVDVFGSIVAPN